MALSRGAFAFAFAAIAAGALLACSAILGIDQFHDVDCTQVDCTDGATSDARPDASDAGDASDAPPPDVAIPDAGPDALLLWARWKMPNPDASTLSEAGTFLPNGMTYADGGSGVIVDVVTKLEWHTPGSAAATYDDALKACAQLGSPWRVPTRIELVSIVDFTRSPAIDPAFAGAKSAPYWTSSVVFSDAAAPKHFTVDFTSGAVQNGADGANVLCVRSP